MVYPKKLIASFANGKISKKEFERIFAVYQRLNGVDFSSRGFGDSSGLYVTYRGQRAVKDNVFEGLKQAKNVYCFVERNFSAESCFSAIHGELLVRQRKGDPIPDKSCIVYIITEGKLYTKRLGELF